MSVDDAKAMLAASAKTSAPETKTGLSDLQKEMSKDENRPDIGAEHSGGVDETGGGASTIASRYEARHNFKVVK